MVRALVEVRNGYVIGASGPPDLLLGEKLPRFGDLNPAVPTSPPPAENSDDTPLNDRFNIYGSTVEKRASEGTPPACT